jgi:hypothetical protein
MFALPSLPTRTSLHFTQCFLDGRAINITFLGSLIIVDTIVTYEDAHFLEEFAATRADVVAFDICSKC